MPLYTVMTQDGFLSAEQRDVFATEIVSIHTAAMSVPADFVHSIFTTYPRNHAYVAANRSPVVSILRSHSRGSCLRRKDTARSGPLESVPGRNTSIRS
jgi:Putative oxalocrotonate tautomerase enzyme